MRTLVISMAVLGGCLGWLCGCGEGTTPGTAVSIGLRPPSAGSLARLDLQYYWKYSLRLNVGETAVELYRLDDTLCCLTSLNRLLAVDAVSGTYKWSCQVAEPGKRVFAPCRANNVVFGEGILGSPRKPEGAPPVKPFNAIIINTITAAVVINNETGEVARTLDFDFAANTGGACDGTYFYVASPDGLYHAVRLADGLTQWTMGTGDMITARPAQYARRLYVGSQDGNFLCLNPDLSRNRREWMQPTDGPISANFHVDARGCFVASLDRRLYALNVSGGELWTFLTTAPLRSPPQAGKQTVFQYAEGDRFYAIDLATGRKRWDAPADRLVVGAANPYVYIVSASRRLQQVDEMLGTVEASAPLLGLTLLVPDASRPAIFAGTADGQLACLRPTGSGVLTAEMLRDSEATAAPLTPPTNMPAASQPASAPTPPTPKPGPGNTPG